MNAENLSPQQPEAVNVRMSQSQPPAEAIDELALQNVIRKRHCRDWPNVVLQLTKRVQAVNQTWNKIIWQIMTIPGLSVNYSREGDKLVIAVTYKHPEDGAVKYVEEVELHEITLEDLGTAQQYIEVLIMDKLDHSELISRYST